jgi:hypothetical protein
MDWPSLLDVPAEPPVVMERAEVPDWLFLTLLTIQGVCWAYTYAVLIYRGTVDRYLGIPVFAVVLNLSWELTFLLVLPHPPEQKPIDVIWVLLDLFILRLAFRYGHRDFPGVSRPAFARMVAGALVAGFVFHVALGWELADNEGIYGAMIINLYMSLAFISLLRRRGSSIGQSMHVAVGKCIGTLGAGAMFFAWYPQRNLLTLCTVTIFVIDLVYIRMLYRQLRVEGVRPWALRRPPVRTPVPERPVPAAARSRAGAPAPAAPPP